MKLLVPKLSSGLRVHVVSLLLVLLPSLFSLGTMRGKEGTAMAGKKIQKAKKTAQGNKALPSKNTKKGK